MANAKIFDRGDTVIASPGPVPARPAGHVAAGYLLSVGMTAVATLVAIGLDDGITIPNVSLVFVVPVIVAGVNFGLGQSFLAAVLGALSYNFFLTEPRYSLMVDDPANIWAIVLLLLVGAIVGTVAFTARHRARDMMRLRRQIDELNRYSRDISATADANAAIEAASRALAAMFDVPAAVMVIKDDKIASTSAAGGLQPQPADIEAARSALGMGSVIRAGTYPASESRFDFWPVKTRGGQQAVIGLAFDPDERPAVQDEFVEVVGASLALALERDELYRSRSI